MKKENAFYLIVLLTILFVRTAVYLYPSHLIIFNTIIHHFWIGILLMTISFLFLRKHEYIHMVIFGIGMGYFIDEFGFLVLGGADFPEYWALPSLLSALFLIVLAYLFKEKIYDIIRK